MTARSLRLAVGASVAALLTGLVLLTLLVTHRLHDNTRAIATDTVERAARAAEAAVNRQILAVDGMLAGLMPLLEPLTERGRADVAGISRILRDLTFQNFNLRNLLLVRPDGSVWAAGMPESRRRPLPFPPGALAEAADGATVRILGPVRSVSTGEWTLFFVRGTDFAGIGRLLAVAEVPVPQVAALLAPVGEAPGMVITVERDDGTLLASLPHDEGAMGRRLATALDAEDANGAAQAAPARLGAAPALVAARPTLYRNILVSVGWTQAGYTARTGLERQLLRLQVGAIGAGLLLLALGMALNLALRQRERGEAERAAARATLEAAIEAMPDGFVMFDADDRLVVSNTRYRELYALSEPFIRPGATFEEIIRGGVQAGQYPAAAGNEEAFIAATCAWHRGDHKPMERLLPDGRWLLVTERQTPDGGTVGIRTDISDLKRTNAELAAARDAASAATRAKSLFLARMSHELRTPLNGVLGLAQALSRDETVPAEARARAATLETAGRHLVAVANDLLDLARIEEGRLTLHPTIFSIAEVVQEAAGMIRPAASEKAVTLAASLDPNLPAAVRGDATRLRQVVLNLLSNAVKFTPPSGRVALSATVLATEPAKATIRIEVRDTGPGVPDTAREAIFGDFVQAAGAHARDGAGLGLAIAAQIVGRMDGRIGCDDAGPEGGALFWLEVPLERPAAPVLAVPLAAPVPVAEAPADRPDRTRRTYRVLVVDDVPSNLAVARALLGSAGHAVITAGSGAEALTLVADSLRAEAYDAILMDLMMPGMDGLETTRRIRAMGGAAAVQPILAVTASAFPEDIAACRAAGMDAHLAKPIERAALLDALDRLIGQGGGDQPLLEAGGHDSFAIPGLDASASGRLRAAFIEEVEQAVRALGAAAADDLGAITAAAHRVAGAAATIGATRLAATARRLEAEARRPAGNDREAIRRATVETGAQTLRELRARGRAAA